MDSVERDLETWLAQMPQVKPDVEAARQRIGRLSRLFIGVLDDVGRQQRISVGDLETLSVIKRAGGTCTPAAIATALELTSGTVSTRLRRLGVAGLVREAEPGEDGRSRPVRLTRSGHRVWRAATAARVEREQQLFQALDEPDLATLNALLAELLSHIEEQLGVPSRHDRATRE